jgi:hypothetical protein
MTINNWIHIQGEPAPLDLLNKLEGGVASKIGSGSYSERDIKYLASLNRPVISQKLEVTAERLERLRAMCQAWDIDFKPGAVTSHRRFVGKFIVAAKRALQPIIKALLKDTIAQQRNFNAAVITAVTDLTNEVDKLRAEAKSGLKKS